MANPFEIDKLGRFGELATQINLIIPIINLEFFSTRVYLAKFQLRPCPNKIFV